MLHSSVRNISNKSRLMKRGSSSSSAFASLEHAAERCENTQLFRSYVQCRKLSSPQNATRYSSTSRAQSPRYSGVSNFGQAPFPSSRLLPSDKHAKVTSLNRNFGFFPNMTKLMIETAWPKLDWGEWKQSAEDGLLAIFELIAETVQDIKPDKDSSKENQAKQESEKGEAANTKESKSEVEEMLRSIRNIRENRIKKLKSVLDGLVEKSMIERLARVPDSHILEFARLIPVSTSIEKIELGTYSRVVVYAVHTFEDPSKPSEKVLFHCVWGSKITFLSADEPAPPQWTLLRLAKMIPLKRGATLSGKE